LQHWDDAAHAWALEPGTLTIRAGASSRDLPVTCAVDVA
jgi:hypothetical protein